MNMNKHLHTRIIKLPAIAGLACAASCALAPVFAAAGDATVEERTIVVASAAADDGGKPAAAPEAPEPPEPAPADAPKAAKRAAEAARHGMKVAADAMRRAQSQVKLATKRMHSQATDVARRQLILPGPDMTAEKINTTQDELAIMQRLVQKAVRPEDNASHSFRFTIGDWRMGLGRDVDTLYIGGYGAVFLFSVDFPLAPPSKAETAEKKSVSGDPAWEKAKAELAGKGGDPDEEENVAGGRGDGSDAYDQERVNQLISRVTKALRHASNLGALGPDERIIVQISSQSEGGDPFSAFKEIQLFNSNGVVMQSSSDDDDDDNSKPVHRRRPTTLTLEVHKGVADDFAKGQLKNDDFARQVRVEIRDNGAVRERPKADGR
jgi:hypothetical protein